MQSLINFFARQKLFGDLFTLLVIGFGVYALLAIKRETFPNVQYDVITVYTIFPGAAPSEVEKLITNPIEQELKEVVGIKRLFSVSTEGRSGIFIILDPDQTTQAEAKVDVQDVIDRIRDLPDLEEKPLVEALESKIFPVIEVSVSGGQNEFQLKEKARWLEKVIEKLPQVAKVDLVGEREYEVRVEVSAKKLRQYQLSLTEIVESLRAANVSIPGGTFTQITDVGLEKDVIVRTEGQFAHPDDVKRTVLRANDMGRPVVLGDVATVFMSLKKASSLYRVNNKDSIRLIVNKKENADAIDLVDDLKVLIKNIDPALLTGLEIEYINDMSYLIRRRLGVLSSNMVVGLILVVLILSLFLPVRIALITAIGIPFSFLGCIAYFYLTGVSLNLITMMGLIIVVGMLVDDAIVVTENAVRRMEGGEEPMEAAVKGTQQIWSPVFASVMTTVLAFFPMMSMAGVFGKFIAFIPLGVITALFISLFECYFILPYHIGHWVNRDSTRPAVRGPKYYFEKMWNAYTEFYGKLVAVATSLRYLLLIGFVLLLAVSGWVATKGMKMVLFPPAGVDQFLVKMKAPMGTSLEQTKTLIRPIEELIGQLPKSEVINFVSSVGEQQSRADEPSDRGSHYAQTMVYLTPETSRLRSANDIIDGLRASYQEDSKKLQVIFERINPGPPVGKPINIGVQGDTYEAIMPMVTEIISMLQERPGIKDLDHNYATGKDQLIVKVNGNEARSAGLSTAQVGQSVLAAFEGVIASSIKQLEDEIDIRVSLPESEKKRGGVDTLQVLNPQGRLISLAKVATFHREEGIEAYHHKNNSRQVTIVGEVDEKVMTASEVAKLVLSKEKEFKMKYPTLSLDLGGEDEDTKESLASLVRALIIAVALIYFILILTFQSFVWPVIVILAIPLGIVSVVWALFVHGQPLSFMAMVGIVALAGVIVNNSIVLVDFIRDLRAQGEGYRESIIKAAKMRLRPIFITTLTTVFGILPTAYGIGGLDPFVVPIAIALGWGLFLGAIMASFFIPAFIAILDDIIGLPKWLFGRRAA